MTSNLNSKMENIGHFNIKMEIIGYFRDANFTFQKQKIFFKISIWLFFFFFLLKDFSFLCAWSILISYVHEVFDMTFTPLYFPFWYNKNYIAYF